MNLRHLASRAVLGLLVFWGCVLIVQAADVKLKVIVENASIRSKPGIDGAVIEEKIPLGAVYLSSKKEGEWYEVRFRSRLGVQLTGYIHEMYVEVIKEGEEATGIPKQPPSFPSLGFGPKKGPAVFELGLLFGLSAGSLLNDSSSYSDTWGPYIELVSVNEGGSIAHKLKTSMATIGGFMTFYFAGELGIRLGVDYNPKQSLSGGTSHYSISWTWTEASGGIPGSRNAEWPVKGDFSVIPLSMSFVYKFQAGRTLAPYIIGGITYFALEANLSTSLGYGESWLSSDLKTQYIDYFIIPVTLNKETKLRPTDKVGGNVGAGLDVLFSPNLGLNIDAICYFGPSQEVNWPVVAGSYPANYYNVTLTLNGPGAANFQNLISKLKFKLTYFRIAGGIKILF